MDIVEFAEKICGVKLQAWQKEALRMHEEMYNKLGGDYKIIMGRRGHIYVVKGKEE